MRGPLTTARVGRMISERAKEDRTVKYFETLLTAAAMSTTFQLLDITAITQGQSQNERIADTVWLERIDMSYQINTANTDVFNVARLGLFKWKESSALALPTAADLFTNYTNALNHSFFNFERRQTYGVFMDNKINLSGVAASPTDNSQVLTEKQIPLNAHRIDYDIAATTGIGKIYLYFFSDSAALPFPQLEINFRVWYYDE